MDVKVPDPEKAQALAAFLTRVVMLGHNSVTVQVVDQNGIHVDGTLPTDPVLARTLFTTALQGNSYFLGIQGGWGPYSFFLMFKKEVIQYFADNTRDGFFDINLVAADSFFEVLGIDRIVGFHMGTTTAKK